MYYLQSRYYNPEWGRFLNADGYVSTGTGLTGCNMYIYCINNPVMYVDYSGMCPNCNCPSCLSGLSEECACAFATTHTNADGTPKTFREQYEEYLSATFVPQTAEERVLNAKYFAFYKGALVVKVPFMNKNAFSLGIIFLGSNVKLRTDAEDVLKHEWGHYVQFRERGPINYITTVGIPSVFCFLLDTNKKLPYTYYSSPFEYEANCIANVSRDDYEAWTKPVYDIYKAYVSLLPRG